MERLSLTTDGRPEYDASGRVRVDCGDYEDWLLPEDCDQGVQDALQAIAAHGGGVAPPAAPQRPTGPVQPPAAPSVSARELAAVLNAPPQKATGRALSPEELAARVRQEQARAARLEADAETARLRAARERAALQAAERRNREAALPPLEIVLDPPAGGPQQPDQLAEARQAQEVAEARLRAYRADVERQAIADQLSAYRQEQAAGSQWTAPGWGCLTFFAVFSLLVALMLATEWVALGPLMLPLSVGSAVLVGRAVKVGQERAALEALAAEERRRNYLR